ncbi:MAG: riboflavin synthase [Desulfovibrionaceae bacterium]|nr:riboflavin synthase [Desulfovibrionaceae bacterium]
MFTGLIQATGRITRKEDRGGECRFTIAPEFSLADCVDGESIAVNGTCLSVERHSDAFFSAYASGETLSRTTLGSLTVGTVVNLERALRLGDRLGGHIVAGHVDCLATVESLSPAGQSVVCRFSYPREYASEVIPKGSVALDGISLTVNECADTWFTVNIIPDTQTRTSMRYWRPGHSVNMETDVLGKYVRRCLAHDPQNILAAMLPGEAGGPAPASSTNEHTSSITREFLLEKGFL